MRIGIDVRVADPAESGQQRYLWRLGGWLGSQGHDVHFLTVREQARDIRVPAGLHLQDLSQRSARELRGAIRALELDTLLLNPERSRKYRGVRANVLRAAYGTDQYRQKLRSFRNPFGRALRNGLRLSPWVAADRRWERAFYERAGPPPDVIAQSAYMRAEILDTYRLLEDRVHVVHNAVDSTEYSPSRRQALRAEMRLRWSIADDDLCLLFLGHNFRLKGLWRLLDVLPRLCGRRTVHLLVAGRGTGRHQRGQASRIVRRRGLSHRVTLAGVVHPALHALAAADVLMHLSWHDSFSFASLEAMACGLPVVTTRHVGASELIEHGVSGLLVDPDDDVNILDAIDLLADEGERLRMGAAAAVIGARQDEATNFRAVLQVLETASQRRVGSIS